MLAHAEHSSFGWVKELGGERTGGGRGVCCWGGVGVVPPMDGLSWGRRRALPPPLLNRSRCASPVDLLGASDGLAVCGCPRRDMVSISEQ